MHQKSDFTEYLLYYYVFATFLFFLLHVNSFTHRYIV